LRYIFGWEFGLLTDVEAFAMGKLLRVLVIILLLASVAALVMAHILFDRREVLRGRIVTMEQGIIRFSRAIESAPAESPAVRPSFPERDISAVTAEPEPSPRRGQFWTNYQVELESMDQPIMDLSNRRRDLMSLYRMDPVTGKPVADPLTGVPRMDGPGTMQGVIDDLIKRAGEQYNTLTATRQQMRVLREELVSVIQDYNSLKNDLRTEKATVVRVEGEREEQRRLKEQALRDLAQANERARELELRINDLERDLLVLREERDTLQVRSDDQVARIATLQERITALESIRSLEGVMSEGEMVAGAARVDIPVGKKGTVISVDQKHLFVVIQLDEAFMDELVGAAVQGRLPMVELFIERGDGERRTFVTKIRVTQIKRDRNLAIGDILPEWQQMDIHVGDRVFYQ